MGTLCWGVLDKTQARLLSQTFSVGVLSLSKAQEELKANGDIEKPQYVAWNRMNKKTQKSCGDSNVRMIGPSALAILRTLPLLYRLKPKNIPP